LACLPIRSIPSGHFRSDHACDQQPSVHKQHRSYQNLGLSSAILSWSSASTPKAVIPQSQLFPSYSQTPQLLNATAQSSALTTVYLRFNESMDVATSTSSANYTLSGGLTVTAASLSTDMKVVTLTTSGNITLGTTTVTANTSIVSIDRKA
jgi:hypothetical protein